jgi:hypothetical protein
MRGGEGVPLDSWRPVVDRTPFRSKYFRQPEVQRGLGAIDALNIDNGVKAASKETLVTLVVLLSDIAESVQGLTYEMDRLRTEVAKGRGGPPAQREPTT